jgi:hypothetical protein
LSRTAFRVAFHSRALLDCKSGDGICLSIVKNMEVFFLQIIDHAALSIADYHRYQNPDYVYFNLRRCFFRLTTLLGGGVRRDNERQARADEKAVQLCFRLHRDFS